MIGATLLFVKVAKTFGRIMGFFLRGTRDYQPTLGNLIALNLRLRC